MAMIERGKIITPDRAKQIRDFSGLLFGTITPTDLDGLIEYHGRGYVIYEVKLSGTQILDGQRLALARLTDDLERARRPALCIIATHNTTDVAEPIDVANAIVLEYRYRRRWRRFKDMHTARELTKWFLDRLGQREEYQWTTLS